MKEKEVPIINARVDDRIEFITNDADVIKKEIPEEAWLNIKECWKNHPIFGVMKTKEIIDWLRGPDSDIWDKP